MSEPSRNPDVAQTRLSLIGFYLSCAGVALGAAFASAGFLWFESVGSLVAGSIVTFVCAITCYTSLKQMRR